jgi:glycine cleavage system aminomethyltransferase T
MITRNEDHIYMVVNAGCADKDMAHFAAALQKWKGKVFERAKIVLLVLFLLKKKNVKKTFRTFT